MNAGAWCDVVYRVPGLQEESLPEKSSEILRELEELAARVKFRPANAVRVALSGEPEEVPLTAGWALAHLVAWALFDQHESKRIPKEERENKAVRRPFRPKYAYKAGQLYLWYHVDYFYWTYETSPHIRKITEVEAAVAMAMYIATAHAKRDVTHRGKMMSALHNDKYRRRDLMFVYHIMDFLVRATLSGRDDLCKVERARDFISKFDPTDEHLSQSGVEKTWNRYQAAAPYIYAFYPKLYCDDSQEVDFAKAKKVTEEEWFGNISQLASKSTLEECLGHAAFAAGVLRKAKTRAVRTNDFKNVQRKMPPWRAFNAEELDIINTFTKTEPLK
jgi:hypothetical protein